MSVALELLLCVAFSGVYTAGMYLTVESWARDSPRKPPEWMGFFYGSMMFAWPAYWVGRLLYAAPEALLLPPGETR